MLTNSFLNCPIIGQLMSLGQNYHFIHNQFDKISIGQ